MIRTLLAALVVITLVASEDGKPAITVAVAAWENRTLLRDEDWLAAAAADLTVGALAGQPGLVMIERSAIAEMSQESALARFTDGGDGSSPTSVGAAVLVIGSFSVTDGRLMAEVRVVRLNGTTWSERSEAPLADYARLFTASGRAAAAAILGGAARDVPVPARTSLAAAAAFYRGQRALAQNNPERAVADLLRAVQRAPDFVDGWRLLGRALEACGRISAAIAAFDHAVSLNPDDPAAAQTLFELALASERDQPETAAGLYRRVIDRYPLSGDRSAGASGRREDGYAAKSRQALARIGMRTGDYRDILAGLTPFTYEWEEWNLYSLHTTGRCPAPFSPRLVQAGKAMELDLPALQNQDIWLVAPPGKALATLTLTCPRPPSGMAPNLKLHSWNDDADTDVVWNKSDPMTATMPIPPSGWDGAKLAMRLTRPERIRLAISAELRPRGPCVLRIDTVSPGVQLRVEASDGTILLTRTPCRLDDLPTGRCRLRYGDDGSRDPLQRVAQAEIELVPGENSYRWRVPWSGGVVPLAASWVSAEELPIYTPPSGRVGAVRANGAWNVALDVGGDVWLARRPPAGPWTAGPLPSPINTIATETFAHLTTMANGGMALFWCRNGSVLASMSADGRSWSQPAVLFSGSQGDIAPMFLGAATLPDGRVIVLLAPDHHLHHAVWAGGSGFGPLWSSTLRLYGGGNIDRDALKRGTLVPEAEGLVWYLSEEQGRRLVLGGGQSWRWLAGDLPMPHGPNPILWSVEGLVHATPNPNRTYRRTPTAWVPLAQDQPLHTEMLAVAASGDERIAVTTFGGQVIALLSGPAVVPCVGLEATTRAGSLPAHSTAAPQAKAEVAAPALPIPAPPAAVMETDPAGQVDVADAPRTGGWVLPAIIILIALTAGCGAWWWFRRRRTEAQP